MAKITITLDLDVDETSVVITDMPGHGGMYKADSYRVRKYEQGAKIINRWRDINDGYEEAQADHATFMDIIARKYGSRVALTIAQLMVADMAWTEDQDREWGRSAAESF